MFKFSLIIEIQAVIRLSLLIAERSAREKKEITITRLHRKPKYNASENTAYSLTPTFKYKSYDKTLSAQLYNL